MVANKVELWEQLPSEDGLYIDVNSRCLAKREGDDLYVVGCVKQDGSCSACGGAKSQYKEIGECVRVDLQQFKRIHGTTIGSDVKMALWAIGSLALVAVGIYGFITF